MSTIVKKFGIFIFLSLSGCAGVTITETGLADFQYRPHFEESQHFFLWGLVGEHHIDVTKVCTKKRPAIQMQSKYSALDVLYSGLTLGLYLPRTAKIWCKREVEA